MSQQEKPHWAALAKACESFQSKLRAPETDADVQFGQFVGMKLKAMPSDRKNQCMMEIMTILTTSALGSSPRRPSQQTTEQVPLQPELAELQTTSVRLPPQQVQPKVSSVKPSSVLPLSFQLKGSSAKLKSSSVQLKDSPFQPSAVQPSAVQPSAVQPSAVQPSSAQPWLAQPWLAQPWSAQPLSAQLLSAQPLSAQPLSAQPLSAQPSSAKSIQLKGSSIQLTSSLFMSPVSTNASAHPEASCKQKVFTGADRPKNNRQPRKNSPKGGLKSKEIIVTFWFFDFYTGRIIMELDWY